MGSHSQDYQQLSANKMSKQPSDQSPVEDSTGQNMNGATAATAAEDLKLIQDSSNGASKLGENTGDLGPESKPDATGDDVENVPGAGETANEKDQSEEMEKQSKLSEKDEKEDQDQDRKESSCDKEEGEDDAGMKDCDDSTNDTTEKSVEEPQEMEETNKSGGEERVNDTEDKKEKS